MKLSQDSNNMHKVLSRKLFVKEKRKFDTIPCNIHNM